MKEKEIAVTEKDDNRVFRTVCSPSALLIVEKLLNIGVKKEDLLKDSKKED